MSGDGHHTQPVADRVRVGKVPCVVVDQGARCGIRSVGRGLCRKHYTRWYRRRNTDQLRANVSREGECWCGAPIHARRLCIRHYYRAWRARRLAS